MKRTFKLPETLFRSGTSIMAEDGTMELSISSDEPYLRFDWETWEEFWEVLSHDPGGMDTTRLANGASLLFNHLRNIQIGTINAPEMRDGKCYVKARVSKAPDVESYRVRMEEGILKDSSVGYELTGDGVCIGAKDGKPIYKFNWFPHEASMVTIPADITVGIGRQLTRELAKAAKETGEELPALKEISVESENNVDNQRTLNNPPPADNKQTTKPMLRNFHSKNLKLNKETGGGTGGDGDDVEVVKAQARQEGIKGYLAKCKKIDDHLASIRNEAWRKIAEPIALKHKQMEDPNLEDFRTEANNAIHEEQNKPDDNSQRSTGRFQVIGERGQGNGGNAGGLSIGAQFVRSKDFQERGGQTGRQRSVAMEIDTPILGIRGKVALAQRAGFVSSDLSAINIQVQQGIVGLGVQRLTVMDLIAPGTTGAAAVIYPLENSFGAMDGVDFSTAAGVMPKAQNVGERGVKPTWTPDLTTATANVKKIAVLTKVPDEFMADFPQAQSYIDERLPYMVDTQTEDQLLYGDGVGNNLKGITTFAGVQTRVVTTTDDSTKAASLLQGLTDIRVGSMFEPDGYCFHPYDWETAQLLKDTSGRFLAGGPYYIPYTAGVFMELHTFWGKPVVVSTAVKYGRPIAGAFKLGAQYFIREGLRLEMTNSNEDDFKRNMIAIRAEHRLALAVYRPACFLEFTAFPARA